MSSSEAELPFLRSSERNSFMRCQQQWFWGYAEQLTPRVQKFKTAAEFGTGIHLALAEYYQPGTVRGPHPADTWADWAKGTLGSIKTMEVVDDELVAKWEDFYDLGCDLMDEYVKHYQGDPHWDIIDAERKFSVTIPDVRYKPLRSEKGRRGYRPICNLIGVFDLCYRDLNDGKVKMTDHKTAQAISTGHLVLDTQASTYIAAATFALRQQGLIADDESVVGMEYNFIRKGKVDSRPTNAKGEYLNKDGSVSARQGSPLFQRFFVPRTPKERQRTIVRISQEAHIMSELRAGNLPILKSTQRDCQYCPFFDLCELDESGGDIEYFKEQVFKKHNPYGDHDEKKVGDLNSSSGEG